MWEERQQAHKALGRQVAKNELSGLHSQGHRDNLLLLSSSLLLPWGNTDKNQHNNKIKHSTNTTTKSAS